MNEQHVGVCRNEAAGSDQKPVETMVSVNKEIGEILLEQRCIIGKIGTILFGEISEEEKSENITCLYDEAQNNRKNAIRNLEILRMIMDRLSD